MADEKKDDKIKTPFWAWRVAIGMIALGAIVIAISFWWGKSATTPPKQKVTKETPLLQQKWQFCWVKKPGFRGDSPMRRFCLPAKIERKTRNYLVVSYGSSRTNGVIEATAAGGKIYKGRWEDAGDWGKIYELHFISSNTAIGWLDEEGQRNKAYSFVLERID